MTGVLLNIQSQIEQGIAILKQGGLVAYPTDTVYGLGAAANNAKAVERIFEVKRRPRNIALPLLLADTSQLNQVSEHVPPLAHRLMEKFWPGALTLVLPKSKTISDLITAGSPNVAVRIPAHPVPVALIKGLGAPIVGTSANVSGQPSPLTAAQVYAQLNDTVDLIIDGGRSPGGKESTIIDVTGEIPAVVREGALSREEIERVCGRIN